jgi:perosamine synthetase
MPTSSDPGGDPAAEPPGAAWFDLLAGPGPRLHPPPAHPREFPAWQRQIRGAVRRRGGAGPSEARGAEATLLSSVTAGNLLRAEYLLRAGQLSRRGSREFLATLVRPAGDSGPWPAVVVCPGRNAIISQVTGAQPPDYPDRNVAARFAAAGFVTLTLDYRMTGRVDPGRLHGRDETAVLAHLYMAAGASLLAELAGYAAAALYWLDAQPQVQPGRVALFGHSLGGAVALHAALFLDHPPPVCAASHLGSYRILGYGHPALLLPGIAADADLPDLYAALAPAPLHLQYGLADHELDPGDAAAAGQRITELYRVAGAPSRAEVHAFEMGHGTAAGPAINFLNRVLRVPPGPPAVPPGAPPGQAGEMGGPARELGDRAGEVAGPGAAGAGRTGAGMAGAGGEAAGRDPA